jgi:response regulator RpfG family c-di-GMP phosphodiesterase
MIRQILEHQGYHVLEAANGIEALEVSGTYCKIIHLVLTDVMMPHMNGRELAAQIRRTMPATRLLFMSGYTDDPMVNPLGRLTMFLPKPFTPGALTTKVREVLDGPVTDHETG